MKNGIEFSPIAFDADIECKILKIKFSDDDVKLVCVVYRPETMRLTQFFPKFEHVLHFINSFNHESIIFGDFNIDTLKTDCDLENYVSLLNAYDFQLRNFEPTRVTPKSRTCIDHMISQNDILTETVKTTISDHYSVLAKFPKTGRREKNREQQSVRNLKTIKGDGALKFLFLLDQKLKRISLDSPVDDLIVQMSEAIMECIDKFAPKQPILHNSDNQWITNSIKNALLKRDQLYQKWIDNPCDDYRKKYKSYRNKVTHMIREAKRTDNFKKLGKNPDSKTVYKTLGMKKRQQQVSNLPDLEVMNEYFANIGSKLSSKLPEIQIKTDIDRLEKTMVVHQTNASEVTKIIREMKCKKSYGEDGITNEIIKCCSPIVENFIAIAFNKCIQEKTYPKCFKTAKVIPLHKKGDKTDPSNYRPISLLSALGKIFEKLLHKRVVKFCKKENILTHIQYGFREKRSCIDAINSVTEFMRNEIEAKNKGQACFIDLQKAFDTLDHEILMIKLKKYGFRGTILEILRKYLSDRYQFVCENGNHSKKLCVKTGVPQGSVLGPFLFLLYINDLQKVVKDSQIVMFADDTTIVKSGKHTDRDLNEDLHRITDWFTASKLTVNIGKCEAISFGNGLPEKITILNEELCYKSSCKYLGLHLDGSLKFREHIN